MRRVVHNAAGVCVPDDGDREVTLFVRGDGAVFDLVLHGPRDHVAVPVTLAALLKLSAWLLLHCARRGFGLGIWWARWRQRRALARVVG